MWGGSVRTFKKLDVDIRSETPMPYCPVTGHTVVSR
jgi:hypothetical protein